MKKFLAIMCAVLMLLSLAACGAAEGDATDGATVGATAGATDGATAGATDGAEAQKYVIGICQYVPHPALDQATEGFIDAVKEGLGEENVEFKNENAAGEATNCTSIVSSFVSADVDLIMANATPALTAAYNATETIPILGTSVTEYGVALGIEGFNGLVGSNVSGTSDLADLEKQAQMILDWCPEAKQVGLLFCNAEANSQYQVDKVQEYLEAKGLTCKQFPFADSNDMTAVTTSAAEWSDVIYVPTDNAVANNAAAIDDICRPAGVPIIAGEQGICSGCGIATMSISYYDLGYATGKMAVKILTGEANIEEMPIEYAPEVTYLYNEEICTELGITPLEGYSKIEE